MKKSQTYKIFQIKRNKPLKFIEIIKHFFILLSVKYKINLISKKGNFI